MLLGHLPFGEGRSTTHCVGACNLGASLRSPPPPSHQSDRQSASRCVGDVCAAQSWRLQTAPMVLGLAHHMSTCATGPVPPSTLPSAPPLPPSFPPGSIPKPSRPLQEFPLCEPLLDGTFKPALHGEYGSHADVEPMHMMLSFKFKPRVVMHVARAVKLFREAGVAHRERPQTGSLTVTAKHKRPGLCWGLDEGVGGPKGAAVEAARPCVSPRDGAAVESSAALGWKAGLALATGRGKMLERS